MDPPSKIKRMNTTAERLTNKKYSIEPINFLRTNSRGDQDENGSGSDSGLKKKGTASSDSGLVDVRRARLIVKQPKKAATANGLSSVSSWSKTRKLDEIDLAMKKKINWKQIAFDRMDVAPTRKSFQRLPAVIEVGFNVFKYDKPALIDYTLNIISDLGLNTAFKRLEKPDGQKILRNLVVHILNTYSSEVPYHNYHHAFAVFHMAATIFTKIPSFPDKLGSPAAAMFLIAALAHDVDHPGWSNFLEIEFNSPLSISTEKSAPLEHLHFERLSIMLMDESCDILSGESLETRKDVLQYAEMLILGTEMQQSKDHLTHLKKCADVGGFEYLYQPLREKDNIEKVEVRRIKFLQAMMHCCDISAQCMDMPIALEWERRIAKEFRNEAEYLETHGKDIPANLKFYFDVGPRPSDATRKDSFLEYDFDGNLNEADYGTKLKELKVDLPGDASAHLRYPLTQTQAKSQAKFLGLFVHTIWEQLVASLPELVPLSNQLLQNKKYYELVGEHGLRSSKVAKHIADEAKKPSVMDILFADK